MQLKQGLGLRSYWGPTRIIYLNIFIQNHLYAGLGHYAASPLKYSRSDLRRIAGVPEDRGVGRHPEIVGYLDT